MVNQENIDSSPFHPARDRVFSQKAGMLLSYKARETFEKTKVRYLPLEEAVKMKPGTNATIIKRRNQDSLTNSNESNSASVKRARVMTESASLKGFFLTEKTKFRTNSEPCECGSKRETAPEQGVIPMSAPSNGEDFHMNCPSQQSLLESSKHNSTRSEVEPGRPDVPAVNAKPRASDPDLSSFVKDKEAKDCFHDNINEEVDRRKGVCASVCLNDPMVLESNLQDSSSKFQKHPLNCPAVEVVWRGSFEVLDISVDSGVCEGFLAHPPAKVSRKAYDFSKQIAPVLQFKLHPRRHLWTEIYQTECPDGNDIALYFYPGNFERSRRKYAYLLKLIEKHDLVLRSRMNCVELLVFGSKQLHADSQKLNGSFFMWGVFRHLKGHKVT